MGRFKEMSITEFEAQLLEDDRMEEERLRVLDILQEMEEPDGKADYYADRTYDLRRDNRLIEGEYDRDDGI